ncbi:MAG: hypothetical protein FJ303_05550 [Planctomycetes bacterium]|nr:hypothetical protein [Planctomycetota bacterium]
MKAEERKELETNVLADKMGQVVEKGKEVPGSTFLTAALVAVGILIAVWIGWRWYVNRTTETSLQWMLLYDGSEAAIRQIAKDEESAAGKAARLQFAWLIYWDGGIKALGNPLENAKAITFIQAAAQEYDKIADLCKDDSSPMFRLQAMLGKAVALETLAVQDRKFLKDAASAYDEIVKEYGKSKEDSKEAKEDYAEVAFAKARLDIMKDSKKEQDLRALYGELQRILNIRAPLPAPAAQKGFK